MNIDILVSVWTDTTPKKGGFLDSSVEHAVMAERRYLAVVLSAKLATVIPGFNRATFLSECGVEDE